MSPSRSLLSSFPLKPTSSCGGGPLQVLGASPHLLYQATHKGCTLLLKGYPPLPLLDGVPGETNM